MEARGPRPLNGSGNGGASDQTMLNLSRGFEVLRDLTVGFLYISCYRHRASSSDSGPAIHGYLIRNLTCKTIYLALDNWGVINCKSPDRQVNFKNRESYNIYIYILYIYACLLEFQEFILTSMGPFYYKGPTLIPAWTIIYIHYKVWGEITHPFPNFNDVSTE